MQLCRAVIYYRLGFIYVMKAVDIVGWGLKQDERCWVALGYMMVYKDCL